MTWYEAVSFSPVRAATGHGEVFRAGPSRSLVERRERRFMVRALTAESNLGAASLAASRRCVPGEGYQRALQRLQVKQQVIAELIHGRLPLLEATARFPVASDTHARSSSFVVGRIGGVRRGWVGLRAARNRVRKYRLRDILLHISAPDFLPLLNACGSMR